MATRIQLRRDIAANWTTNNPILLSGELGVEEDTNKFKVGNGTSNWDTLPYQPSNDDLATLLDQVIALEDFSSNAGTAYTKDVTTSPTDTTAGSILKVGDFGVGKYVTASGIDLDTLINVDAVYYCIGCTNTPKITNGYLEVRTSTNVNYQKQVFHEDDSDKMWVRTRDSGVWGNWVEIWTTDNLVKTTSFTDTTAGRILKVSDFGVGALSTIEYPISNFDIATGAASGMYRVISSNTGTTPTGFSPFANIWVNKYDVNNASQIYIDVNGKMAFRHIFDDVAQDWRIVYNSGNSVNPLEYGLGTDSAPVIDDFTVNVASGHYRCLLSSATGAPEAIAFNASVLVENAIAGGSGITFLVKRASSSLDNQKMWIGSRSSATGAVNWVEIYHSGNSVNPLDFGLGGYYPQVTIDADTFLEGYHSISCLPASTNIPLAVAGMLTVYPWQGTSNAVQTYTTTTISSRMFTRFRSASVWSDWVEIWNSNNLVKTTSVTDTTENSITKVNDFGIGSRSITFPPAYNLDTHYLSGNYVGYGGANASASIGNNPFPISGGAFSLTASGGGLNSDTNYVTQTATELGSTATKTVFRSKATGTWSPWREIYNSGNLIKTTSATDSTDGSVVTVSDGTGWFGLGGTASAEQLTTVLSLDNITKTGFYGVNSTATTLPSGFAGTGTLLHNSRFSASTGTRYSQLLTDQNGNSYTRVNIDGTWSDWREVYHSGNSVNPLDFGLGVTGLLDPPLMTSFDANKVSGLYRTAGGEASTPFTSSIASVINLGRTDDNGVSQIYIRGSEADNKVQFYARGGSNATFTDWVEFYHSGNTNFNEFGGLAGGGVIATGYARATTIARFYLPINSVNTRPTSITVTSNFNISSANFVSLALSVTPVIASSASTNKICIIDFEGLTGLTVGEPLILQLATPTSKITVNF